MNFANMMPQQMPQMPGMPQAPNPQMLGGGMAARGGQHLQMRPMYDKLVMQAAMGEGPQPPPYEEWLAMLQQQQQQPAGLLGR